MMRNHAPTLPWYPLYGRNSVSDVHHRNYRIFVTKACQLTTATLLKLLSALLFCLKGCGWCSVNGSIFTIVKSTSVCEVQSPTN